MPSVQAAVVPWPQSGEYQQILQAPSRFIRIPRVQNCQVEQRQHPRTGDPIPRFRKGGNALVYKLLCGAEKHAFRVFLHGSDVRERRYLAVDRHLKQIRSRVPGLINFEYFPQGIFFEGSLYPVLLMDWVEGIQLDHWLKACVDARDQGSLRDLAEKWVKLVRDLRNASVAHGDLQHGNVLIKNSQPYLVDYDCMCVPDLVGQVSPEGGLPGYQHAKRVEQKLSFDLDHFSAWIIWLSLRGIAAQFELYEEHVVVAKNDNILFTDNDLRQPDAEIWGKLFRSPDAEVKAWAHRLHATLGGSFDSIPKFDPDPFTELRDVCAIRPRQWENIEKTAKTILHGPSMPSDLAADVAEASIRVQARADLVEAVKSRQLRKIVAKYKPNLVDDWHPQHDPSIVLGRKAVAGRVPLDDLEKEQKTTHDGKALQGLWTKHKAILAGFAEAVLVEKDVVAWANRIAAAREFLDAVGRKPTHDVADAWRKLTQLKGHPDAEHERTRGEQAVRWSDCLRQVEKIDSRLPVNQQDILWDREWLDTRMQGCPETPHYQPRADEARTRLDLMRQINEALRTRSLALKPLAQDSRLKKYPPLVALQAQIDQVLRELEEAERREGARRNFLALLDSECQKTPVNWRTVLELANNGILKDCPLSQATARVVHEVRERDAARLTLLKAIQSKSARRIDAAFRRPPLLDDWKEECERLVDQARAVRKLIPILDHLENLVRTPGDGRGLVGIWKQHATALSQFDEGRAIKETAEKWQKKLDASKRFLDALSNSPVEEVAAAWEELERLAGHPDAEKERARGEQALRWRDALRALDALILRPSGQESATLDKQIEQLWKDGQLEPCPDANARLWRPLVTAASARLQLFQTLWDAVENADSGRGTDRDIIQAASQLPQDYEPSLRERLHTAAQRVNLSKKVLTLLRAIPRHDCAVAEAWRELQNAGGQVFLPHEEQEDANVSVQRDECIKELCKIPSVLPEDKQNALWIGIWKEHLLPTDCEDAKLLWPRFQRAKDQTETWNELKQAVDDEDVFRVAELAHKAIVKNYPPMMREQARIRELETRGQRCLKLFERISKREPTAFDAREDRECLRTSRKEFEKYCAQIAEPVNVWSIDEIRLAKGKPDLQQAPSRKTFSAHWQWKKEQNISYCLMAIDGTRFFDTPAQATRLARVEEGKFRQGLNSFSLQVPTQAQVLHVTVWPILDLGWITLAGEPLRLGPLTLK